MKYDYYTIEIPKDLGDAKTCCAQAITEARERARLWCVPADWAAHITGENALDYFIRVRRRRNK